MNNSTSLTLRRLVVSDLKGPMNERMNTLAEWMSGERLETSRFFSNWLVQNKGASFESKISFLSHIHVRRAFADLKYVHYRTHCVWTCRKET